MSTKKTKDIPAPSDQLIGYLAEYDLRVGELALALREIVLGEAPDAIENVFKSYVVATNYSFTGKSSQSFCYVAVYTGHVNLGFTRGVDLEDPKGLLIGEGKQMRHLKVLEPQDLKNPYLRPFLRAAIKNAKSAMKTPHSKGSTKRTKPKS